MLVLDSIGRLWAVEWDLRDFKVDQCFVMNGVFFRLCACLLLATEAFTVSGGGSMTVRAVALQGTDRLQISVFPTMQPDSSSHWSGGLLAGTSAVGRLFSSLAHLALKMKLNTSRRQVQAASDGALLRISFIDQLDAALPYVAVRRAGYVHYREIGPGITACRCFLRYSRSQINRLRSQWRGVT